MFSTGPVSSGIPLVEGAEGNPDAALALVLRLLGRGFDFPGYENPMRLLVGRIPDPLTTPIPLPEGAPVIGSQILGPIATIVVDVDQQPPAVLDFCKERLPADGWTVEEPHILLVIRPSDAESEYVLYLRADMAAGAAASGGFGTYSVTSR